MGRMSKTAMSDQKKFILLTRKIRPKTYAEMRADRFFKRRTETFIDLKNALMEKSEEDWQEKHLVQLKKETIHALQNEDPGGKPFGKGKGKGKGAGQQKGKGLSKSVQNDPPNFQASITCKHCGEKGH